MDKATLRNQFTYHAPNPDEVNIMGEIREMAYHFAAFINEVVPESADKTVAIRKVREAVMNANAAIVLNRESKFGFPQREK